MGGSQGVMFLIEGVTSRGFQRAEICRQEIWAGLCVTLSNLLRGSDSVFSGHVSEGHSLGHSC